MSTPSISQRPFQPTAHSPNSVPKSPANQTSSIGLHALGAAKTTETLAPITLGKPLMTRFKTHVEATTYTRKSGVPMEISQAYQETISKLEQVKEAGGTVYVIGSGKDQISHHFVTDLMKGLEIGAEVVSPDAPALEVLQDSDLVVVMNGSEAATRAADSASRQGAPVICIREGEPVGDINFSISQTSDQTISNMCHLFHSHAIIDLYKDRSLEPISHLEELCDAVDQSISTDANGEIVTKAEAKEEISTMIKAVKRNKGTVYIVGNGGSDQIATDIRDEILKKKTKAKTLTANSNLTTCLSNDKGYQDVFSYQLTRLLKPNDLLIAISSSGKSANILNSAAVAKDNNIPVITLSGFADTNPLRQEGEMNLYIQKADYGLVEMGHFFLLLEAVKSIQVETQLAPGPNLVA